MTRSLKVSQKNDLKSAKKLSTPHNIFQQSSDNKSHYVAKKLLDKKMDQSTASSIKLIGNLDDEEKKLIFTKVQPVQSSKIKLEPISVKNKTGFISKLLNRPGLYPRKLKINGAPRQ
ncbi:MAG: hypothetical protein NT003_02085 [Candidatus Magasanikbacteria bacterium]|nr:hypothetical protein [Candidatus Magasanikbacteria bacterium]